MRNPSRGDTPLVPPGHRVAPLAAVLLLLAIAGLARADSLSSLHERDYPAPGKVVQQLALPDYVTTIVYPTIGCPSIVAPGGELRPVVLLANGGATLDFRARLETSADAVLQTYDLAFAGASYDSLTGTYDLAFTVPSFVPEDYFDLVIESAEMPAPGSDRQAASVRVLRDRASFDFVAICDTQIFDANCLLPQKFEQVLRELRLRSPALIVFSGDMNYGNDYPLEYPHNYGIIAGQGVPLHMVPGNHDGLSRVNGPGDYYYDGLFFWRKVFGAPNYAFDFGPFRFLAINSYAGPTERRNSFTFLSINWGGEVDPATIPWIEAEARDATAGGKQVIPFMHHNPRATIVPNKVAYPYDIRNVSPSSQQWNDPVSQAELLRIFEETNVTHVFLGHREFDQIESVPTAVGGPLQRDVKWIITVSPDNGNPQKHGYRVVEVRNGQIASL